MRTRAIVAAVVVVVAAAAVALIATAGSAALSASAPKGAHAAAAAPLRLVAVGDSLPRPNACDGCTGFLDLYAKAVETATGRRVEVDNRLAIQFSNVPAVQVSQVFAHVYTDDSLRAALADADIVLVNVGFNDTSWARLDNPCEAAPDFPVVRWRAISDTCQRRVTQQYKQRLDEVLTQIDELRGCGAAPGVPSCSERGHEDSLLRVVSTYNAVIGDDVDPGWNTPQAARVSRRGHDLLVHAQCEGHALPRRPLRRRLPRAWRQANGWSRIQRPPRCDATCSTCLRKPMPTATARS